MSWRDGQQKLKRRKRSSAKTVFDENKEINVAVKTGKVLIGTRSVMKELASGNLHLLILASNTPKEIQNEITMYNNCLEEPVPIYNSKNSSWELGAVCGKPFWIALLGVLDEGNSSILNAIE